MGGGGAERWCWSGAPSHQCDACSLRSDARRSSYGHHAVRVHRIVQTMIVTACVCIYLFWLFAFLAQLHPLVAPNLELDDVYLKD